MSMPIQRQAEQYEALNGDTMFWGREARRQPLPASAVADYLSGPRISAGLNNPGGITRQADAMMAPSSMGNSEGHPFFPDHPGVGHEDARERQYYEDQEHGYGQEAPPEHLIHEPGFREEHPGVGPDPQGFGFGGYDDFDPHSAENLPPDEHYASFSRARAGGPAPKHALTAPAMDPLWLGHGYAPGHRVGLPWRDAVIPGTVTHLDGTDVGVRWDDQQHTTEDPRDLRPL